MRLRKLPALAQCFNNPRHLRHGGNIGQEHPSGFQYARCPIDEIPWIEQVEEDTVVEVWLSLSEGVSDVGHFDLTRGVPTPEPKVNVGCCDSRELLTYLNRV